LLRAADLLWPHQQDRARTAFADAFELAEANFKEQGDEPKKEGLALLVETPDQRYVVIRTVARRDPVWARKLTEQMLKQEKEEAESEVTRNRQRDLRTGAKLLASASSLLTSDAAAAISFARISLRYPASIDLARFLYRFAEVNQTSADQFYGEAIAAYSDKPLSEFLYLSAYPFGNDHAAGDMPVTGYHKAPANFVPNRSLQTLFIQALLVRAQQALAGNSDKRGFSGISDDGQIWLALTRLEPQVQQSGSGLLNAVEAARANIYALLSVDDQKSVSLATTNHNPPPRTFDEQIEAAEKEPRPDKHDQLIVSAVLRVSDEESVEHVIDAIGKINDSNIQQQVRNWFYFTRTQSAVKEKQLEEARKLASKVEELDQRTYLYSTIAQESLGRNETQAQAREVLDEILSAAGKAPNTIVTARALLAVAHLYTRIDVGRSISVLGDAIKLINRIEAPNFSQQVLVRKIEGKNFARYATFQMPGFTPENVFSELGKVDFDDALYQANSLADKSVRCLMLLVLAETRLQQVQSEQRNEKVKPKIGSNAYPLVQSLPR